MKPTITLTIGDRSFRLEFPDGTSVATKDEALRIIRQQVARSAKKRNKTVNINVIDRSEVIE